MLINKTSFGHLAGRQRHAVSRRRHVAFESQCQALTYIHKVSIFILAFFVECILI